MRHDFTAEQGIFIVQFAVGHERSAHVPRLVACQFFFCMIHIIIPLASEVSSDRFCILPVEASGLYPFT